MHDDMVKEQGLVVDFYVAREETSEVMHISIHIHSIMKGGKTQYTKMQTQFVIFLYFLALFSDHHHFKAYLYFGAIKRKYMYMIYIFLLLELQIGIKNPQMSLRF